MAALSAAQEAVVALVVAGESFRCVAHAGAGKSTTAIAALQRRGAGPGPALLLQYNREAKLDARQRAQCLDFVRVENFDSLLISVYDGGASLGFDAARARVVREDSPPLEPLHFTTVIIDEAQDLSPAFVAFARKVLRDARVGQVILLGDVRQAVNGWRGASAQWLQDGEGAWLPPCTRPPRRLLLLDQTYRLPQAHCALVNAACAADFADWTAIVPRADAPLGATALYTAPGASGGIEALLERYLVAVAAGSVALLTDSLQPRLCPMLWWLVRVAGARGVRHSCGSEPGAVELHTIHSVKGCEWDAVFLFIGSRWTEPRRELLYVAMTRARRELVLIEDGARVGSGLAGAPAALDGATGLAAEAWPALHDPGAAVPCLSRALADDGDRALATGESAELEVTLETGGAEAGGEPTVELTQLEYLTLDAMVRTTLGGTCALTPLVIWARGGGLADLDALVASSLPFAAQFQVPPVAAAAARVAAAAWRGSTAEWAALAALHPALHGGHVGPWPSGFDVARVERALAWTLAQCGAAPEPWEPTLRAGARWADGFMLTGRLLVCAGAVQSSDLWAAAAATVDDGVARVLAVQRREVLLARLTPSGRARVQRLLRTPRFRL